MVNEMMKQTNKLTTSAINVNNFIEIVLFLYPKKTQKNMYTI